MRLITLAVLVAIGTSATVTAADAANTAFADHLFGKGDFFRAVTEYERALYESRGNESDQGIIKYKLALCHEELGEVEKAMALYEELIGSGSAELRRLGLFKEGLLYFRQQRYSLARDAFQNFREQFPDDDLADEATYLSAAAAAMGRSLDAPALLGERTLLESSYGNSASRLRESLDDLQGLPVKSVGLAGTMSALLPGSGQCYAGRCKDGIAALGFNGVFGGLIAAAFLNDEEVLGGILAFIESWFYFGNIYSARSAAHKYNQRAEESALTAMLRHVRLDVVDQDFSKRIGAVVSFEF